MRIAARRIAERLLHGLVAQGPVPGREPHGTTLLAAVGLDVELGGRLVLEGVDLEIRAGELVALVGPNGAGKSTLLAALSGDLVRTRGRVEVAGQPVGSWTPLELARRRAVLPQQAKLSFPFTVGEVVAMGRSPWEGTAAADEDGDAVRTALADADVTHLSDRRFPALSGGERGRVALARALAQRVQLLLLDEPTAALDIHHQELVLRALRRQVAGGAAVVVVVHDLALAAAHADRVAMVCEGRLVADGPSGEVLTAERLTEVYRHPVEVLAHPRTGDLLVAPVRSSVTI